MDDPGFRRVKIPQHRSIRGTSFAPWRIPAWGALSLIASFLAAKHAALWTGWYVSLVGSLLHWAGAPFTASTRAGYWLVATPAWSLATYNPVADPMGALTYGAASALMLGLAIKLPRIPMPLRTWLGLTSALLLITTLSLFLNPVPRLTPETFSRLWCQVALGTTFLIPTTWALLVGLLPLPMGRVALTGLFATITVFVWNACRLAFCLTLAAWAGVVWLPPAFILGCALPDILVLVAFYGLALEGAGRVWEGGP